MTHEFVPVERLPAGTRELTSAEVLVDSSGPSARERVLEFFTAWVRNRHTHRAYGHAVKTFLGFSAARGITRLQNVNPVTVSVYVESHPGMEPTKKVHLAGIRHFFDWPVTGQVVPVNPALSVRGPRHVVTEGGTPAFDVEQALKVLRSIEGDYVVSKHDRAIVACLICTVAGPDLRVGDFLPDGTQWGLKFREKASKARKIPVRHDIEEVLREYMVAPSFSPEEKKAKRLTSRGVTGKDIPRMFKRRLREAELPENFSCHSFRATTITDLLEQGVPIDDIQYLAGHADKRTIGLYDRRERKVTRNIVERISI